MIDPRTRCLLQKYFTNNKSTVAVYTNSDFVNIGIYVFRVVGGFNYSKMVIVIPGHIAIVFGTFLEFPKNRQNVDPQTPCLLQKIIQAI